MSRKVPGFLPHRYVTVAFDMKSVGFSLRVLWRFLVLRACGPKGLALHFGCASKRCWLSPLSRFDSNIECSSEGFGRYLDCVIAYQMSVQDEFWSIALALTCAA